MHGLLLHGTGQQHAVSTFIALHSSGLRPARSANEEPMDMHVIIVAPRRVQLNSSVTLFASTGTPGTPISSPGSWLVQLRPCLWPLNHDLCRQFYVLPCACESWRPREDALAPFAMKEANMAIDLYQRQLVTTGLKPSAIAEELPVAPAAKALRAALARSQSERRHEDEALLAALSMPLVAERTTLADAYSRLSCEHLAPSPLSMFLLRASRSLGAESTLHEAFQLCANTLKRKRTDAAPPAPDPTPAPAPAAAASPVESVTLSPADAAGRSLAVLMRGLRYKPCCETNTVALTSKQAGDDAHVWRVLSACIEHLGFVSWQPSPDETRRLVRAFRKALLGEGMHAALQSITKRAPTPLSKSVFVYVERADATAVCFGAAAEQRLFCGLQLHALLDVVEKPVLFVCTQRAKPGSMTCAAFR
jgi:hypothetical protein